MKFPGFSAESAAALCFHAASRELVVYKPEDSNYSKVTVYA